MNSIPNELINLPQWVVWKLVPNPNPDKKDLKIPINIKTGNGASTTNPATWATCQEVQEYLAEWQGHEHSHFDKQLGELTGVVKGPGFVFSKDDPYCGIDLDNCIDDQGYLADWARKIAEYINSYTEISQSKKGIHIVIKGKKPDGSGCKKGDIECYDQGRFFAMTGNIYGGDS
jgi:putative DNA primase/helicase